MTFHRLVAAVVIASQLVACAGTGNFEAGLQSNVGVTEQNLVDKLGPPDSTYKLESDDTGTRYLTWTRSGKNASSNSSDVARCRITFKVGPDSRVQAYSYDGNACNDNRTSGPGWWDVVGTVLTIAVIPFLILGAAR